MKALSRQLLIRRRGTNGNAAEREFDTLYRQHYVQLLRASMAITLDLEVARDLTHEAFARLWERRDRMAPDSNEKAWLMRVTVNLSISHRRGWLSRLRQAEAPQPPADPASLAMRRMETERMRSALLGLPPRQRAVLALHYGRGLSFAEIGAVLDQPEGTVRTLNHRALQKLRVRLSDWVIEEPDPSNHELVGKA